MSEQLNEKPAEEPVEEVLVIEDDGIVVGGEESGRSLLWIVLGMGN